MQLEAGSNNEAEYATLFKGLLVAHNLKIRKMIRGDSLLVEKQILGS